MNPVAKIIAIVLVVGSALVALEAAYVVRVTEQAIVLRLGEYKRTVNEAGLHWKMPLVDGLVHMHGINAQKF